MPILKKYHILNEALEDYLKPYFEMRKGVKERNGIIGDLFVGAVEAFLPTLLVAGYSANLATLGFVGIVGLEVVDGIYIKIKEKTKEHNDSS